jgi:hypothetical protein
MFRRCKEMVELFLLVVLLGLTSCDDLTGSGDRVSVGIYNGAGVWQPSVTAISNLLDFYGLEFEVFNENDLFAEGADRFNSVIIPGGDPRVMITGIGEIGRHKLKNYVMYGGGYIGFGAGAAIADADSGQWQGIGLFRGDANWPVDRVAPYPLTVMTDLHIASYLHPITFESADRYVSMSRWGPEFLAWNYNSIDVLYNYAITNTPAVISFNYGAGKVVLSGCQLEIEEDSDRDGVHSGDLHDPDSEWALIEQMLRFCLEEF